MKRRYWYLGGILLLATFLRSINIESRSIQYDDAFSIFLAARPLQNIISGTAADTMPPLYYFALHYWMMLSQQLWFLRTLSILLSLGCVFFIYKTVGTIIGEQAALWSAGLAAISPLQIYHAQDIRMYALLAFGQLGYIWFFSRLWKGDGIQPKLWNWVGLILFGTIAMYCHNLAVFVLVAADMLLILQRQWRFLGKLLLAQVAIGLLAIPWLFMLPGQISKIQTAFWTPPPGITELLQSIILFHASIPLPGIWLIIGAILSVQIIFLVILQSYRDKEDRSGIYFLALFVILPPALIFVVSYMMRPVFVTRGFIASSLAYYGLMGIIIARYWQTGLGKIIAGLFVATVMIALPYQVSYNDFPRAPYREAMEYLGAKVRPGDSVVHDNKLSYFPSKYYAPNLPQNFLADQPNSPNDTLAPNTQEALGIYPQKDLSSAVGSSAQVYFIVFQETINEYISGGENDHPALAWLKQHYQFVDQTNFRDLEIFHYSRP